MAPCIDGAHERLAWGRAELDAWAKHQARRSAQAGVPVRDSVWNLEPPGKTPEEALLKSADPRWWRRAGARKLRQAREAALLAAGRIGHDGQRYASDAALAWQRASQAQAQRWARESVIFVQFRIRHYDSLEDFKHGRFHRNARRGAQCQLDLGAPQTPATEGVVASFASYVLKYVAKACGVSLRPRQGKPGEQPHAAAGEGLSPDDAAVHAELVGAHEDSLIDSGTAARVRAHRSTWGIRGIEFYGIPKGAASCWDLLRQVRLDDDAERAALDPAIAELAAICQRDKGQGFADYLRLLGGLACSPLPARYVVKPVRVKVATQYGGQGERLVGVQVQDVARGKTATARVRPLGRQLLRKEAAEALVTLDGKALAREAVGEKGGQGSAAGALVYMAPVATSPPEPDASPAVLEASSAQQRRAIELPVEGHHAIVAAAGSGKTHLLVERAAWLLQQGVPAHKLVLTTFSRKAAEHLRERLHARGVHGVQVGTMHALARRWLGMRGGEPDFEGWLRQSAACGKRNKWLLVDEAQDLSEAQWAWVEAHGRAVFAVGDERQAIYAWRGAKAGGLTQWAHQSAPIQGGLFESPQGGALSVNRRCAAPIVALANALPLGMPATQALHTSGQVQLQRCVSRDAELQTIVEWLSDLDPRTVCDVAVLARSNAEAAWLKARLRLRGIDAPVMTIHAAKGREWDAVVLALGLRKPSEAAEEALQTWYVGITRAKRQLLLTSVGCMPHALEDAWAAVSGGQAAAAPQDGSSAAHGTADATEDGQAAARGSRSASPLAPVDAGAASRRKGRHPDAASLDGQAMTAAKLAPRASAALRTPARTATPTRARGARAPQPPPAAARRGCGRCHRRRSAL